MTKHCYTLYMKLYYYSSGILFALVALFSFLSRREAWYNTYWYTDVILHFTSGVALGLLWIALTKNDANRLQTSSLLFIIGAISFAVFGSVLWESWEFAGWRITPSHTQFYIPELGDTLSDVFCGLLGGVLAATIYMILLLRRKK